VGGGLARVTPTAAGQNRERARFELLPAIDLLEGRCVRLSQGDYQRATVYGEDPAAVAAGFAAHAIPRLHVVDLDGARAGKPVNLLAIAEICARVRPLPVQVGGGLRRLGDIAALFDCGVERAILGTVALRDPALVKRVAAQHPGRIAVGIDAREGRVAVEGWLEDSQTTAVEIAKRFEDAGVAALIHTDIARDGMLSGPNLDATRAVAEAVSIPVIVSGGVSSEDDLVAAARLRHTGITGAIIGRALYTGAVDLARALARVAAEA
jgi:phosphoribosylformimino-5-aminoimidazole carboxamide ribotide isomerase